MKVLYALAAIISLAVLLYCVDAGKPQPFTKIEALAWENLRDKEEALSKERREFALELCKAHAVPVEECRIDTEKLEVVRAPKDPPKEEKKDSSSKKDTQAKQ